MLEVSLHSLGDPNSSNKLFAATVRLEITDIEADKFGKSKTAYGSGVAIGFDVVLTAAHNLRCSANSPDRIHRALTVKLCLGFHDNGNPHPTAVETRYGSICAVLREWAHGHEYEFNDMAIIKLDHPFKVLKPAKYSAPPLGPLEVRILEYPGDNREQVISRCENAKVAGCMYEVKGSATYDRERKVVEFALSTMGGIYALVVYFESLAANSLQATLEVLCS